MKLGTKGRYAVMALADLALHGRDGPVTLADIASRQEISLSYLEQLFAKMRRARVVESVRGPGGGYKLARAASETRIADVVTAVDEPMTVTRCSPAQSEGCMSQKGRCLTHDLWDELGRHIYLFLNAVSLEDVIERRVAGAAGRGLGAPAPQTGARCAARVAQEIAL
ncbi:MAG: Rrf2 family transcriptional regulator [Maricaulaceae bacterium]